jgi:Arabinose-binding domain of AraC transcription regulator, N-term
LSGTDAVPVAHDSVEMARLLLGAAAAAGVDARRLAADARLPGWALGQDPGDDPVPVLDAAVGVVEHALEDPQVALMVAARHQVGDLDLYDYLFTTSATLRDAMAPSSRYLHLITTVSRLRIEAETGTEATYSYRYAEPGGRYAGARGQ